MEKALRVFVWAISEYFYSGEWRWRAGVLADSRILSCPRLVRAAPARHVQKTQPGKNWMSGLVLSWMQTWLVEKKSAGARRVKLCVIQSAAPRFPSRRGFSSSLPLPNQRGNACRCERGRDTTSTFAAAAAARHPRTWHQWVLTHQWGKSIRMTSIRKERRHPYTGPDVSRSRIPWPMRTLRGEHVIESNQWEEESGVTSHVRFPCPFMSWSILPTKAFLSHSSATFQVWMLWRSMHHASTRKCCHNYLNRVACVEK